MKRIALVALVLLGVFVAGNASAQSCPTSPQEVSGFCGGWNWNQDQSCYSVTSGVSAVSPGCSFYDPAWTFTGAYLMSASTSITPASSNMASSTGWSAASFVEFSGSSSAYDWIELVAVVTHNGYDARYSLFYWDGTMGTLNGCAQQYGVFSASAGDTVSVRLYALNANGATIKASVPRIFDSTCGN
jgi:hypothetical protein